MRPGARFVTGSFGRVFAVRWRVFVVDDLAVVRRRIAQARNIVGQRLVYLSLIPASPRDFTEAERDALTDYLRDLLAGDCASIHHVIAGTGFAASARRSIVTNMALAAARPGAFHTYATLEAAAAEIADETLVPKQELLDDLKQRGLAFSEKGC